MRSTLAEWAAILKADGEGALISQGADAFLVTDPASVFNIPVGPSQTMRVDRQLFLASTRGEFHGASPTFAIRQQPGSVYSFVSVGRTENCDICLPDDTVSKLHALLRFKDGLWTVQDADSANGTTARGEAVPGRSEGRAITLEPGDKVSFGQIELYFHSVQTLTALMAKVVG